MKGFMGGLYRIAEWIMRFSAINILWVICSLPIFFFGLTFLIAQDAAMLYPTLVLMGLFAPFTFFPATSAMFSVARKWVIGDADVPLMKTFFTNYKQNFKQALVGGLLYTLLIFILIVNYYFYSSQESGLAIVSFFFIAFLLIVFLSMFNFFSILSHLHMKTIQVIKNAFLITIGRPGNTFMLAVINGFILYLSFFEFTFLIPFFMGSLIAFMSYFYFNRTYDKILMKQEQYEEDLKEKKQKELYDGAEVKEDQIIMTNRPQHHVLPI